LPECSGDCGSPRIRPLSGDVYRLSGYVKRD